MRRGGVRLAVAVVTAALVVGLAALPAMAASGGAKPKGTHQQRKPPVAGLQLNRGEANAPSGQSAQSGVAGASSVLPFTGAELSLFVLLGLGAIGSGTLLVLRSRRMGWRRALLP